MNHQSEFYSNFWRRLGVSFRTINLNTKAINWKHLLRLRMKIHVSQILGRYFFYLWCIREKKLRFFVANIRKLADVYSWLGDDYSKSLMIELIVRKILGFHSLAPLIDLNQEKENLEFTNSLLIEEKTDSVSLGEGALEINFYNLTKIGYSLVGYMNQTNIVTTFIFEQYRYGRNSIVIEVKSGETVIDAGGCWGDTALYMASKGAKAVYSFEFLKENLVILNKNLISNPEIAQSIRVVKKAVWCEDDKLLYFQARGPATKLSDDINNADSVQAITIDTFVENEGINCIDFIKMDIEGSELDALVGAKQTIAKFGPKLAITVYHKPDDLFTIPHFLKQIRPDYEFFLDHFTTTKFETVLFAIPKSISEGIFY